MKLLSECQLSDTQPPQDPPTAESPQLEVSYPVTAAADAIGITTEQWAKMVENGRAAEIDPRFEVRPVVKLQRGDRPIQILLAEVKPGNCDLAFGLIQLGSQCYLRFISLSALVLDIEMRRLSAADYQSDLTLTEAALAAERDGRIRDYAAEPCPLCNL